MKTDNKNIKVVYTPEQFKELGFDGEIAQFMRDNPNTAIVGYVLGVDRHVIQFRNREDWMSYRNPYSNNQ